MVMIVKVVNTQLKKKRPVATQPWGIPALCSIRRSLKKHREQRPNLGNGLNEKTPGREHDS